MCAIINFLICILLSRSWKIWMKRHMINFECQLRNFEGRAAVRLRDDLKRQPSDLVHRRWCITLRAIQWQLVGFHRIVQLFASDSPAMKWVLRRPQISIEQCSFWIADGQIVKICTTICWRNLIFWTWQWLTSSGLLPKAVRHMGAKYISAADITSLLYISISSIFYVHSHANKCLAL